MSKNKKAIIYVRVGSLDQNYKNKGDQQIKVCTTYAHKKNFDVIEIISDFGKSSNKTFPELVDKLLNDKRKIDVLITYQFDRLSRNLLQFFSLNKLLQEKGIDIAIASSDTVLTPPGIEPRLPGHNRFTNILLSLASYDNNIKSQRIQECMKEKFRDGYWLWQCPFGYKKSKKGGPLSVDTKHAEVVKKIFAEANNQDSLDSDLLSNKYSLSPSTVRRILKNPFYKGEMFSKKWNLAVQGRHQPLVDTKTWERAQT